MGLTAAEATARVAFPKLAATTPMTGELVMFKSPGSPALRKPEPAWLITWDATTHAPGPAGSGQGLPVYQHMNVLVSARTGRSLLIFPSP